MPQNFDWKRSSIRGETVLHALALACCRWSPPQAALQPVPETTAALQLHYRNNIHYRHTADALQHGACTTARYLPTAWAESVVRSSFWKYFVDKAWWIFNVLNVENILFAVNLKHTFFHSFGGLDTTLRRESTKHIINCPRVRLLQYDIRRLTFDGRV